MTISIDENIRLELISEQHTSGLFEAVDANRMHLSRYLPWVKHMRSEEDARGHVENCVALYNQGKELGFVIIAGETIIGRIGLQYINRSNNNASIGYWLAKDWEGRGIISNACREIMTYGFKSLGLHRIEIRAAVENKKSRAVAERLHCTKEGVLRQAEYVNNEYLDLAVYSLLEKEWRFGIEEK